MEPITSKIVTEAAGISGALLHNLCNALRVGQTRQGSRRHFRAEDAMLVVLAGRLIEQGGHRNAEAIAIALKARGALRRFARDPDAPERWLWAWRSDESAPWRVEVTDDGGSPAEDGISVGPTIVVNLRALARTVLKAEQGAA